MPSNPLLCVRCEIKTKRTGKNYCDRCIFEIRREIAMREAAPVIAQQMKLERAIRRNEEARRRRAQIELNRGNVQIIADDSAVVPRNHEVSYLTDTGIRFGERYRGASIALERFLYLKERNIMGLRYLVKQESSWILVDEFHGQRAFPVSG